MRSRKGGAGTERLWAGFRALVFAGALAGLNLLGATAPARAQAEAKEIRIAVQYGIAFLPLLVAEDQGLVQKHLKAVGLNDANVRLVRFSGAPAVNEAMLSGNIELATYGTTGFLTAWDRTRGNINIKGICGIAIAQTVLLANRPDIQSVRDFKPEDRISVPATVSPQAVMLRMAAEQAFGMGQHNRLDTQLVVLPNPDGLQALINRAGIAGQVTSPPFYAFALQKPGIHRVVTSEDVLGGPSTFLILATTEKFANDNPKTIQAVFAAMEEAMEYIRTHRRGAAEIYIRSEKSTMKPEFIEELLQDPANSYSVEPLRVMKYAEFMGRAGTLRHPPDNWKELFLPIVANRNGS